MSQYGLVWNKPEQETITQYVPVFEDIMDRQLGSCTGITNMIVEGDNLHTLQVLQYTHRSKIDMIYIDPPYNTGNKDFRYNDAYVDREDSYRHSKWLNFMEPRLKLARNLLKETGVIFISIDDNELYQLKLLMDQIFGENNFVANMVWEKNSANNNSTLVARRHEYILIYAKSISSLDKSYFNVRKTNFDVMISAVEEARRAGKTPAQAQEDLRALFRRQDLSFSGGEKQYNHVDGQFSIFTISDLSNPGSNHDNPEYNYELINPETKKPFVTPSRGWLYKENNLKELLTNGSLFTETRIPRLKRFLKKVELQNVKSTIEDNTDGTKEVQELFSSPVFSYPKPSTLMKKLIAMIPHKDALILDFFAGSGTLGHAVLDLNAEDGGTRSFILATNNENKICEEVTYPRIKKVIEGYTGARDGKVREPRLANLKYYKVKLTNKEES